MTSYAGVHHDVEAPIAADNHGVLFLNSHVRYEDVTDGTSQTLFVGEKLNDGLDLGWASGTRASLRNTGERARGHAAGYPAAGPARRHVPSSERRGPGRARKKGPIPSSSATSAAGIPAASNFLFGDGSVKFIKSTAQLLGLPAPGPPSRRRGHRRG